MNILLYLVGILAGAYISIQAPLNAAVAARLGHPVFGAAVSFTAGLAALLTLILVLGLRLPPPADLRQIPLYLWVGGGLLGVAYMVSSIFVVPRLGVATVVALVVAGQLLAALLIDHMGLLGVAERPITLLRFAGAVLLMVGVTLIARR